MGIHGDNVNLGRKGRFGKINIEQFQSGIEQKKFESKKEIEIFKKYDKNRDGQLSQQEIAALINDLGGYADNGRITRREARKFIKQNGLQGETNKKALFEFLNKVNTFSQEVLADKAHDSSGILPPPPQVQNDTPSAVDPVVPDVPEVEPELSTQDLLLQAFGGRNKVSAAIDGTESGLTARAYEGQIIIPNGTETQEGKFPDRLNMTLPASYGQNAIMKLKLIDEENGIYESSAHDRNFQVSIDENGHVSLKSVNTDELNGKLKANLAEYELIQKQKELDAQRLAAEENAKKQQEAVQKGIEAQEKAKAIATELYDACDDEAGAVGGKRFAAALKQVNKDNVMDVLSQYDEMHPDESLISTICEEWGSDKGKKDDISLYTRQGALNTIMLALTSKAQELGVSKDDIDKAKADFEKARNHEFYSIGTVNTKDMDTAVNFLRGAIEAKMHESNEMTTEDAISQFNNEVSSEFETANKTFTDARNKEGWVARSGDTVLGWFGCTTKEDMETKLGTYKADVEKLQNAKTEAEFKTAYKEVFGIEFDPKKIEAYNNVKDTYTTAVMHNETANAAHELMNSPWLADTNLAAAIKEKFGFDDEQIEQIITQYKTDNSVDNMTALKNFLKDIENSSREQFQNVAKGKTLEQLEHDVELVRKSAFGTKDIVKDVIEYNENQEMTDMIGTAALEIGATVALQFVPGLGQMATARLAVSAARWGAKGAKLVKYAGKAEKAFAAVNKFQKGEVIANSATKTAKVVNKGAQVAFQAGNAGIATMGVDLSDGKSVKEATRKALMNMSFAGVGASSSILAPKLMQTFGISNKLATEIAEEIVNAAGSYGVTEGFGDDYGKADAFVDFASGIIMSRISHIHTAKPNTPEINVDSSPRPMDYRGEVNNYRDVIKDGEVARNADQKHLNAHERAMVEEGLKDIPTEADVENWNKQLGERPTPEQQAAIDAHNAKVAEANANAHQIGNNLSDEELANLEGLKNRSKTPKSQTEATVSPEIKKLEDSIKGYDGQIKELETKINQAKKWGKNTATLEKQLENLRSKRSTAEAELKAAKSADTPETPKAEGEKSADTPETPKAEGEKSADTPETPKTEEQTPADNVNNGGKDTNIGKNASEINQAAKNIDAEIPADKKGLWTNCKAKINNIIDEMRNFSGNIKELGAKCKALFSDLNTLSAGLSAKLKAQIDKIKQQIKEMFDTVRGGGQADKETA